MKEIELQERYEQLFPTDSEKAMAFDKIAKQFYYGNFGTMQKSDIETLLFSLYLDRILEQSQDDMQTYSDYTLSKYLGITQNKVESLKVKKELKYPYPQFDWKKSFERISKNAQYENGKIKIHIPDKNLYLEIKNAVESVGGYVDVQLNSKLLQMSPSYFINLVLKIADESEKEALQKTIKDEIRKKGIDVDLDFVKERSIKEILKENAVPMTVEFLGEIIDACVPVAGSAIKGILLNVYQIIQDKKK